MSTLPDYRFNKFRFYTPVGVAEIRVEGQKVIGEWRDPLQRHYGERGITVAERFVNCGWEPEQIVKFTEKYGPLSSSSHDGSREFSFPVESWRSNQWEFRKLWASIQHGGTLRTQLLEVGQIEIRKDWLHFKCGSLWDFMTLELLSKREKVRFCRRPECDHPYFTAQHGKEQYCSTNCANWAQSEWKRQWHETQRQKRL